MLLLGLGRLASDAIIFGVKAARVRFAYKVKEERVDLIDIARFLDIISALLLGILDKARFKKALLTLRSISDKDSLKDIILYKISVELNLNTPLIFREVYISYKYK